MGYTQSEKLKVLTKSEIRNMSVECEKARGINLSQGVCDLELPDVLAVSAFDAMSNGLNHYTRHDGIDLLRQQIAKKVSSFNGIPADPEKNITVSSGATGALYSACFALLNPGDEVILFEPYYGYHEYTLLALGVKPVFCTLRLPDYSVDFEKLEELITGRTRGIILNTPSNPCGKVFEKQELLQLSDFCNQHDLIVFSDEIYEYITFDGRTHLSPGSLPELAQRTVTISGYSKTFSITGWRIGYAVAGEEVTKWIGYASDLVYVCAPAPLQYGVAKAIEQLTPDYYASIRDGYQRKRDMICSTLNEVGLTATPPQGAYYVLADFSRIPGESSKDKAMWLLHHTGVAVVPGNAFYQGSTGDHLARLCFAKDEQVIADACERLMDNRKLWRG